ncbi:MAG: InlB B-repeat-containing protein [Treponema sp.]|nr:InlB B-repeat-containing protein [Treponema sp.]
MNKKILTLSAMILLMANLFIVSCKGNVDTQADSTETETTVSEETSTETRVTYTVTFNANDGSESPATESQTFTSATAQALKTVETLGFSKEHYDFLGWATSSTATEAAYTDGASYTATSDITLYAVWEISAFYTPLTLEFTEAGTITITNPWSTLKYQVNGGDLTDYPEATEEDTNLHLYATISVNSGDKIAFYAEESENYHYEESDYEAYMNIDCTSNCYIYGNIMSLLTLDSDNNWNPEFTTIEKESALRELFIENTHIRNHNEKTLYLPATSLTSCCYFGMFSDCTSLTTAPSLPATTLAEWCYEWMFSGCTSLTTAPELPATTLAEGCYSEMFYGCTSLNSITCLATDISAEDCTGNWLYGVASSGTFTCPSSMKETWTTNDTSGIPSGWTVQDYTEE